MHIEENQLYTIILLKIKRYLAGIFHTYISINYNIDIFRINRQINNYYEEFENNHLSLVINIFQSNRLTKKKNEAFVVFDF